MKAYKAFDAGYICRGYKYTDKEHHIKGKVKLCDNGFHACLDPYELRQYYNVNDKDTVYAIVDISGPVEYDIFFSADMDDKVAATRLKIIKKFDNIQDLYDEFEKNGNPTIDYIKKHEEARQAKEKVKEKEKIYVNTKQIKDILHKKDNVMTFPKALFFGLLVQMNVIDPNEKLLATCTNELRFIANNLRMGADDTRKLKEPRVEEIVEKDNVVDITKLLTAKEYKEFHKYTSELKKLFNVDIVKIYKHKKVILKRENEPYKPLIINLPRMKGDIKCK